MDFHLQLPSDREAEGLFEPGEIEARDVELDGERFFQANGLLGKAL